MNTNLRETSEFRRGVAAATEGYKTEIACDVWPTAGPGGLGKLGRTVSGAGDMNPPWQLIDQVLRVNPAPVLDAIASVCGVRWERVAAPAEETLAAILVELAETQQRLAEIGRVVEGAVGAHREIRKVEPRARTRGVA